MATYTHTRVRGLAPWKPQAPTRALLAQIAGVLTEYRDHLPLTARQIYYRLVGAFDYPKTEQGYERLLNTLNRARRAGIVPFNAIRDDGVTHRGAGGFDVPHFLHSLRYTAEAYRSDRLAGQPVRLELWVEAAGMVPQAARIAEKYGVPTFSSGGFDSTTAKYEAARRFMDADVPVTVLHIGDHDPSGISIFDAATGDVTAMCADLGRTDVVSFARIAVTTRQIKQYALPDAPPKDTDRRGNWRGATVQVEAMTPEQLAGVIETAIRARLDLTTYAAVLAREATERAQIVALVGTLATGDEDGTQAGRGGL